MKKKSFTFDLFELMEGSSNIGVTQGHPQLIPQGMAARERDVLRPSLLLQNWGFLHLWMERELWIGSGGKMDFL